MFIYPLGLIIAIAAIWGSLTHLDQSIGSYYDLVAILVVFGGTTAVAVITLPWVYKKDIFQSFSYLFVRSHKTPKETIEKCMTFFQQMNSGTYKSPTSKDLYLKILADGQELISLGMGREKVEQLLVERVVQHTRRRRRISNAIRSLAKYPPAFGLMGTVLGLVNVMQAVSQGADGKHTAIKMALALVATMYGLIVANLLINPAGELIFKRALEEEAQCELAIRTVLLVFDRASLLEAQETLNSFVPESDRINLLGSFQEAA